MPVETNNENVNNNGTSVVDGQPKADEQQQKAGEEQAEKPKQQSAPKTTNKKVGTRKRKSARGKSKRKSTTKIPADPNQRTRLIRSFPASTFEDALPLAEAIQQFASGQKVRRLTLFDHLKKSPDSSYSRQLITNSTKYGLTSGSYKSEYLELTQEGKIVTNSEVDEQTRLKTKFKLAIENIQPFNELYENLKGNKLPAQAVLKDFLLEKGYKSEEVNECVETFIVNAKYLTLLRPIAGSERLLPLEHILEELPKTNFTSSIYGNGDGNMPVFPTSITETIEGAEDWSKICFYITPIGAPGSEQRRHSDLFLGQIVEPALEEFGLKVVRADHIGQPGMITSQIIEHIIKSRLAIADLSFHNANVFYELCLRHAFRLPAVQLIRVGDSIPFDLNQVRTIIIDNTDIYTLLPQLESFKAEIANQVRRALNSPDGVENPLTIFYPNLPVIQNA